MSRRFLVVSAVLAALVMCSGLLVFDIPLVHAIHGSTFENLPLFIILLGALDITFGMHVSYWLAPSVCLAIGLVAMVLSRVSRLPRALAVAILTAGLVQASTIGWMMLGKQTFGRFRPLQLLESGDWSLIWFAGGGSFPSGHSAFYFGLFLPLAASAPVVWQRAGLLVIPVFAICARLDVNKHFLSDVAASALIAACMSLLALLLMRQWRPAP